MAADGYGQRQTGGGGLMAEGGGSVDGRNGSGGIKMNMGRLLRILFFARDQPVASFFCRWICPWLLPKQITNKQKPGRFARGQKKDSRSITHPHTTHNHTTKNVTSGSLAAAWQQRAALRRRAAWGRWQQHGSAVYYLLVLYLNW